MAKLILIRHGQSVWNLKNVFTGWTNVELSENGVEEAKRAGQALKNANISFDVAFTSLLKRAVHTFNLVAQTCDLDWVELHKTWRLNERHYGALQGLNKAEVAAKHGEEQVHIWRRSYDVRPPLLSDSDKRNPKFDPMYGHLDTSCLPLGESLKDCIARTMPYWYDMIAPNLINGKNCIVAAHGNSLRGLVKYLENIGDSEISNLEIPTGVPIVYDFDKNLKILGKGVLK